MLVVISPAKTLDFDTPALVPTTSFPVSLNRSEQIVKVLRKKKVADLMKLMDISNELATLNVARFASWTPDFENEPTKPALLAFKGEVYLGMDAATFSAQDLLFAQKHLRILSGLHGMLLPLDALKPYRLEMGTSIAIGKHKNLYGFWKEEVTKRINTNLTQLNSDVLVNLASEEYFKVIDTKKLKAKVVTCQFKDFKNGNYKVLSFFAKKARGMMSRYIIQNNILDVNQLKNFNAEGYYFSEKGSTESQFLFLRDE